jgi:poly(glycerol-phosphate) alpha-glucosyltransferase
MIKSAHLTHSVSRKAGGLLDAVLRLVQSQDAQEMGSKVFGLWDEFAEEDANVWKPVPVAAFKTTWPQAIRRAPQMMTELVAFAPDITHVHGLWLYPSIAAKNYSRQTKRPNLISPHGMLDSWALKNSQWKKKIAYAWFEREHLCGTRCLRALCESEAQSIRQLGLKNDIAIIPNGIDLPTAAPTSPPPWVGRIEPGSKVLLFLSRIHPKKGLVNLLKAWAKNQKSADWTLAIAGWDQGGHEQELKRLCAELQIAFADIREPSSILYPPSSVLFLGPQFKEAKAACYHHCDAFVLPSFSEGLPMVVLEAWANSKPVIVTPECNLPEGFLVGAAIKAETTEASLAAGLSELQRMTPAERAAMGSRALELVKQRFTWSRVGEQMAGVYQWALGGGSKPGCVLDA